MLRLAYAFDLLNTCQRHSGLAAPHTHLCIFRMRFLFWIYESVKTIAQTILFLFRYAPHIYKNLQILLNHQNKSPIEILCLENTHTTFNSVNNFGSSRRSRRFGQLHDDTTNMYAKKVTTNYGTLNMMIMIMMCGLWYR